VRAFFAILACLCALGAGSSLAQGYAGVVPGSDTVPENLPSAPGDAPVVTWPGFQVLADGSTRVFVQTSIEVKPELKRDGETRWLVLLPGVTLPSGNARLPLDTQYFNTPVKTTRIKPHGKSGVAVVLELRTKSVPKVRTEQASNGYFFTYIEFEPGNYLSAAR
jgi:hypothetical protein